MPQIINTNLQSMNAQRSLSTSQGQLSTSMQRLSSGLRVNSAKDDAAGLSIAERMTSQVRGMNTAVRNANDGISMSQTAEGAMGKVVDSLQRMRELAVQSANATNSASDRTSLDKEFGQLAEEIQRVLGATTFNGHHILADSTESPNGAGTYTFQVGANTTGDDTINIETPALNTDANITAVTGHSDPDGNPTATRANIESVLAGDGSVDAEATLTSVQDVIDKIDTAIDKVSSERATMGASQSRFESTIANLQISVENQSAAKSRIMDTDFAAETANMSRANILQQAGNAMVAQANQLPQQVLSLLR